MTDFANLVGTGSGVLVTAAALVPRKETYKLAVIH